MSYLKLSDKLENLQQSDKHISLGRLNDDFGDKSFALIALILMSVPALPLPTGGATHIFEIITMLLSLELILGRKKLWLPQKWLKRNLPPKFQTVALPKLIKLIRNVERLSKPRLKGVTNSRLFARLTGIFMLILTFFAFAAPPFSGLDTLPALGVVLIALALLLEDAIIGLAGLMVGSAGIVLEFMLGKIILKLF